MLCSLPAWKRTFQDGHRNTPDAGMVSRPGHNISAYGGLSQDGLQARGPLFCLLFRPSPPAGALQRGNRAVFAAGNDRVMCPRRASLPSCARACPRRRSPTSSGCPAYTPGGARVPDPRRHPYWAGSFAADVALVAPELVEQRVLKIPFSLALGHGAPTFRQ